ncbi:TIR domain-containing protein [Pseudomonas sp. CFA]|nr:TIR domain-containing protein [Pseudomonas sp. CFA]
MAKRVFFSFHYQDVIDFRANVVRNHWMTKPDRETAGYFDASVWETAKKQGEIALKRLINGALENTSNSCILVGSETYARPWVRYEIMKSFRRGNHMLGIHVNSVKGKDGFTKKLGPNPFLYLGVSYSQDGKTGTLWEKVKGEWVKYERIDGSATFAANVGSESRGKGFNLSHFYKIYDWSADDGYNNFSSWLK